MEPHFSKFGHSCFNQKYIHKTIHHIWTPPLFFLKKSPQIEKMVTIPGLHNAPPFTKGNIWVSCPGSKSTPQALSLPCQNNRLGWLPPFIAPARKVEPHKMIWGINEGPKLPWIDPLGSNCVGLVIQHNYAGGAEMTFKVSPKVKCVFCDFWSPKPIQRVHLQFFGWKCSGFTRAYCEVPWY